MWKSKWAWIITLLISQILSGFSQTYQEREELWVQETLNQMTTDQKIGQLFIIRAYSRGDKGEENILKNYIKKYHLGGLCFFQGQPEEQARLVNVYQNTAELPLFIGLDAEWGLPMRMSGDLISFPKQMMLGALKDNDLIYEMGREIARHCRAIGVNINFAPVVDINNNPKNPIVFDRSFGESPHNVTAKSYMYIRGLEDNGVMACIKHFPGHGDTDKDSHHELPLVNRNIDALNDMELYPFRRLINNGINGVMVGHLQVPVLDNRADRPASLSQKVITDLLRTEMGYNGLVFTDAMEMKAITNHFPNGEAEVEAFLAGNDVILLPNNIEIAFNAIKKSINDGTITIKRLNASVERILRAKYRLGLDKKPELDVEKVTEIIHSPNGLAIKQKIAEKSATLLRNKSDLVPIKDAAHSKIAVLSIHAYGITPFQSRAEDYSVSSFFNIVPSAGTNYNTLQQSLSKYDIIIVGIHTSGKRSDFSSDLPLSFITFLKELDKKNKVITVLFGSPYQVDKLDFAKHLLVNYNNDPITQDMTMQTIFGTSNISGKLPISVSEQWPIGYGLETPSLGRLGFMVPEAVGMMSEPLKKIDAITDKMISDRAAPGAQVVVARKGKIIFNKNYGHLYTRGERVTDNTLYDVASITKILSTTLSTMKLYEEKKIDIDAHIDKYISGIDTTNKAKIKIGNIMSHTARLRSWIGFYKKTTAAKKKRSYNPTYYAKNQSDNFSVPIAKNMYMRDDYIDTIYQRIWDSELLSTEGYKYSDLGFYIMKKIVEKRSKKGLDQYVKQNFYEPLGLKHTGYNPLNSLDSYNIAPSEIDDYWRMQIVRGTVHDMGAAMLGGVGGHAGLFSTGKELTILMQMLLNQGYYGGVNYLKPETVQLFTSRYGDSTRRGLGFDMKETDSSKKVIMSKMASSSTFGHTGFTGSAVWADPENDLIFVFNTNRTYPHRNTRFEKGKYRIHIQDVVYQSILN